jgi:hypothetical protein
MPLEDLSFATLESLIRQHLSTREEESTTALIRRLSRARARGHLTRTELRAIGNWKSARAIRQISANSPAQVRRATKMALRTRSERLRLQALLSLRGVSLPMASAILTLLYPRRYGVIDIRVWQLLHGVGAVSRTPNGVGFTFDHWNEFLSIVRTYARQHGVKARDIERALFEAHRHHQRGRLYARR